MSEQWIRFEFYLKSAKLFFQGNNAALIKVESGSES